jgi:hypothetical protein
MSEIAKRFLTDSYGPALMTWADEQRAIGERMIEVQHLLCDLVETLDANRVRYTQDLTRA